MKVFWSSCLLHAIAVLVLSIDLSSSLDSGPVTSNKPDDKLALVAFKGLVTKDPFGILNSWNDSLHYCEWSGIKCSRRHRERVTALELYSQELEGKLSFLKIISLDNNQFTGAIPASLTNASRLEFIHLESNQFSGSVPMDLGRLQHLRGISFYSNLLRTTLGDDLNFLNSLTNCTKLEHLNVGGNYLYGSIPTSLGNLTQLKTIWLSGNGLIGSIPTSIGKLKSLNLLNASQNQISGSIPSSIGKLKSLNLLDVSQNQISGPIPTSLGNLTQLKTLWLSGNELIGSIPTSIGKLKSLNLLVASLNQISGPIPTSLGNLTQLKILRLSRNELNGSIPTSIGKLKSLNELYVSQNRISGPIPPFLSNLTQLKTLWLSGNELHGSIPTSIGKLESLNLLDASQNRISGSIPTSIGKLKSLNLLDVSQNQIWGPIPTSLGNLTQLTHLSLSRNELYGSIPSLPSIKFLKLSNNAFSGSLPFKVKSNTGIQYLDLSNNKLSGKIPDYLGDFTFMPLSYLDLSYNDLDGPVPITGVFMDANQISVVGNNKLCGGIAELKLNVCPVRNKGKSLLLKAVVPVTIVSLFLVLLLCFLRPLYQRRMLQKKPSSLSLPNHQYPRISYAELLDATIGFSAGTLLGAGRYGTVYKGFLEQLNEFVAVKVLNVQERGAYKSFLAECNALRNIRHRNLVKIVTCCSSVDFQGNDFKALVYEFIPNGSLEEWLHQRRAQWHEMRSPNFLQRLNIAIDVASALDYLHHHCQSAIVHCDLKPSNILLDDKMTAHLSDFGLAKVFSATNSSSQSLATSNMIKGSIGYIPPEYGMGGIVSIKGDVYSYGILLLEMFTGRRPTDDMFQEGRNLHNFATMALPGQIMNIIDPTILLEDSGRSINIINQSDKQARIQDCLVSVLTLGVKCSAESPMNRLNMAQVVTELHHIKEYHQGTRIRQE